MSIEALWYEVSPYVYAVVGMAAALFSNSVTGFVFSALLLSASLTIFRLRRIYRSPDNVQLRKYSRPRQAQHVHR